MTRQQKIITIAFILFCILLAVTIPIAMATTSDSTSAIIETPILQAYLVKSPPMASYGEFGNLIIEGIVENRGDKEATFVEAEATFCDSNKHILGRYSDYLGELAAGESWRYSIMYLGLDEGDVDSFSVDVTYR